MPGFIKKQCLDRFRTPAKGRRQSMWGAGATPASKPAGHPGLHSGAQSRPSGPPQLCTEQAIRACHSCAQSRPAWPEVAFQRPLLLLSCLVMSSSLQPHGYSPPGPSVCGRQEYWSRLLHATLRNKEFTSWAEEKRDRCVFGRFSCLLEPNQAWVVRCDFSQVKPVEEREPGRLVAKLSG